MSAVEMFTSVCPMDTPVRSSSSEVTTCTPSVQVELSTRLRTKVSFSASMRQLRKSSALSPPSAISSTACSVTIQRVSMRCLSSATES